MAILYNNLTDFTIDKRLGTKSAFKQVSQPVVSI